MSERKLVTIRRIDKLVPIDGADRLECAHIDGWKVVVGKGIYNEGDKVVYFEVDSFIPIVPEFEFLRDKCYRVCPVLGEGLLIKTIKLRKQISQGLVMSLDDVFTLVGADIYDFSVGADLTGNFGVRKWDATLNQPISRQNISKGDFPYFIPKTDQERLQNIPRDVLDKVSPDKWFHITEKLDGSSITVYKKDGVFGVCSRNLDLKPEGPFWDTVRALGIEEKLRLVDNIALQGEHVGPGIQGNKYKLKERTIFFFDVFHILDQEYAITSDFQEIIWSLGLETVPVLHTIQFADILREPERFFGKSDLCQDVLAEGFVARALNGKFSFKCINPEWLLKNE